MKWNVPARFVVEVFKLIYARYLAEVGLAEEALQYCDVISGELGKMGNTELALMGRAGKTIKKYQRKF